MSSNVVKCRYCEFKAARFTGRGKLSGPKRLFKHVIDCHEDEFLEGIGFAGTLMEYLDMVEEEEYAIQEDTLHS